MKPIAHFSRKKFQALSPEHQLKAISRLLYSLDERLASPDPQTGLIDNIKDCLAWITPPLPESAQALYAALDTASDRHQISAAIARYQAARGIEYRDYNLSQAWNDGPREADPAALARASQIVLILDNLRSAFNVGSIFRTAECLSVKEVWLCGVCADPSDKALQKTAMGTTERVNWRRFADTLDAVEAAKNEAFHLCALETTPSAVSVFETAFPLPLAIVAGNESLGIDPKVLSQCGMHVSLPVQGWKNSLNVAVALAICAYQAVFAGLETSKQQGIINA